jgi:Zn-dependent protease
VSSASPARKERCRGCGIEVPPDFLACPACHALVHSVRLKELAAQAEAAEAAQDLAGALARWREALPLVPASSRQHEAIRGRLARLSARVDAGDSAAPAGGAQGAHRGRWAGLGGGVATAALLLWKLKFLVVGLLSKGKLLLLGLTKASTLLSMGLALGAYWAAWGWRFAAGLVAMMYVHELGHVAALRRYGIPASAPMFVPGIGAFVRLGQRPARPGEDARIGLAGPIWGLAATGAAWAAARATGWPGLLAVAHTGAWLNLFNLLPAWQLDGGRAFVALGRAHRVVAAAALLVGWLVARDGLLLVLALVAAARALEQGAPRESDRPVLAWFVGAALALAALAALSRGPAQGGA